MVGSTKLSKLAILLGGGIAAFTALVIVSVSTAAWLSRNQHVAVDARVDPMLDSTDGAHPMGLMTQWKPGTLFVMSERESGGWVLFAAHREAERHKVERVDIRLLLAQSSVRAEAAARWYEDSVSGSEEHASDMHGVVSVDASRMPTAGDDRIISYSLDALRDGKPVHFTGKIVASVNELDTTHMLR